MNSHRIDQYEYFITNYSIYEYYFSYFIHLLDIKILMIKVSFFRGNLFHKMFFSFDFLRYLSFFITITYFITQ
ncbi:hypothetical protein pb186bvf_014295 [Paramecium bursaria]